MDTDYYVWPILPPQTLCLLWIHLMKETSEAGPLQSRSVAHLIWVTDILHSFLYQTCIENLLLPVILLDNGNTEVVLTMQNLLSWTSYSGTEDRPKECNKIKKIRKIVKNTGGKLWGWNNITEGAGEGRWNQ